MTGQAVTVGTAAAEAEAEATGPGAAAADEQERARHARVQDRAMAAAGWTRRSVRPRRYTRTADGVETTVELVAGDAGPVLAVRTVLPDAGRHEALAPRWTEERLPVADAGPATLVAAVLDPALGGATIARGLAALVPLARLRAAIAAVEPLDYAEDTAGGGGDGERLLRVLSRVAPPADVLPPALLGAISCHYGCGGAGAGGSSGTPDHEIARVLLACRPGRPRPGGGRLGDPAVAIAATVGGDPLPPGAVPVGDDPAAAGAAITAWIAARVAPVAEDFLADARAIGLALAPVVDALVAHGFTLDATYPANPRWRRGHAYAGIAHCGDRVATHPATALVPADRSGHHFWGPWDHPAALERDVAAMIAWVAAL